MYPLIAKGFHMPATKNAMTRYALIDKMLANRNRAYSIQDITDTLAERLPKLGQPAVSKRCVEKDLNYLEFGSPFDVEIEEYWIDASDKNDRPYRKRCIRYADPTFSIFKPKLTEDEKTVLATALYTLGSFDGLDNFEWLNELQNRLNIEAHEPFISLSKNLLTNSTLLARLFTTIRLKQVINLNYHVFQKNETRTVSISPHLLKEYNNRWYLIASASDTKKILTFALDRIDDFMIDAKTFYISAPDDLQERYEEIIGVTYSENAPLQKIEFWVSDNSCDYIETKPIHGSQKYIRGEKESKLRKIYPQFHGGSFFLIECRENYELIRELTSFGANLVVLSPENIRNSIKQRINHQWETYHNLASSELSCENLARNRLISDIN